MTQILLSASTEAKQAITRLFEDKPPLLVEVRFPNSATAPDWHLFDDEEQLDQLLERIGHGVELRISSVWDLTNVKGEMRLRK